MHCASFRSQKQSVINCADLSEESTALAHCRDKLTLAVKNKHLTIGAENKHEASELRDDTLLDLLLDVDALLQLKGAL